MEGGSANGYDYTSGDPVNMFDLGGLCEALSNPMSHRVMDFLIGDICAPPAFPYSPVVVKTKNGKFSADPKGDCTASPESGPFFNFHKACQIHDYGYDLLRFFKYGGDERRDVDRLFRREVFSNCSGRRFGSKQVCQAAAFVYAGAVQTLNSNLWNQYETPGENI